MGHSSVQTGRVSAGLTPRPLPLDAGLVIHDPHVAAVVVGADVGLVLYDHNGPFEKILAPKNFISGDLT